MKGSVNETLNDETSMDHLGSAPPPVGSAHAAPCRGAHAAGLK